MLQDPGEPLRSPGSLRWEPGRHRSSDRVEFPFDRRRETVCTTANERLEPRDRQIEPAENAAVASLLLEDPIFTSLVVAGLPIALERHDGSHDATLVGASDTDRERRARSGHAHARDRGEVLGDREPRAPRVDAAEDVAAGG